MPTSLGVLLSNLPGARLLGDRLPEVAGIAYDSRRVRPGELFVCVRGASHDGHRFAADAVAKGACALIVEEPLGLGVPEVVVPSSRAAMGAAAAAFYGFPSRRLRVIGVTGTNGKTTTTYLVRGALERAGRRTGLIGTVEQVTGAARREASRTTPESVEVQALLAEMVESGCAACVMEVSSHGLVLERTAGTEFDVAIFTNLTHDHLDFHKDLEEYLEAKTRLFRALNSGERAGLKAEKRAIVNADDPHASRFIEASGAPVVTYGIERAADFCAGSIDLGPGGVRYVARTPEGPVEVRLRLPGRFNVYNSLAALAAAYAEGVDLEAAAAGMAGTLVPGRFEPVDEGQPFAVIVDYAHAPDSLENVLRTARSLTEGRLICVFGAGGDRDRRKRPVMGRIASHLADVVYITSDNPRSEDPAAICAEIAAGAEGAARCEVVVDRREAIRRAVDEAEAGDFVLIAGKGHETYQEVNGVKLHFDDREEAALAIRGRMARGAR